MTGRAEGFNDIFDGDVICRKYFIGDGSKLTNVDVDLSGYVPYTGATGDVDLGDNKLTTNEGEILGNLKVNGKLAVGEAVGSYALAVNGNARIAGNFYVTNGYFYGYQGYGFGLDATGLNNARIYSSAAGAKDIIFRTNSVNRGTIKSDGELEWVGLISCTNLDVDNININGDTITSNTNSLNLYHSKQHTSPNETGISIISSNPGGAMDYAGDINIKCLAGASYAGGNINLVAQRGGAGTTGNGEIHIYTLVDDSEGFIGAPIHIYAGAKGGTTGAVFLQEEGGAVVCGTDTGDPDFNNVQQTKLYVLGDTGGILQSPSVCKFIASNARDAYAGGEDGGDSIIEATNGGDSTGGNGNGGDGGDIILNPGAKGIKSGTGSDGTPGVVVINSDLKIGSTRLTEQNLIDLLALI